MTATQLPQASHRYTHPDYCVWTGYAHGVKAEFGTSDPRLIVYVNAVCTDRSIGVELVDEHGNRLASEVHLRL
jgi:hypothetical protein